MSKRSNNYKRDRKKRIVALIMALVMVLSVALLAGVYFFGSDAEVEGDEKVVATVGGVNIYDYEVRFYAKNYSRTEAEMLDELISSTRIMLWAKEKGVTASDAEIKKVKTDLEADKKQYGEEQLNEYLKSMNITEEQYVKIMQNSVRYTTSFNAIFDLDTFEGFKQEDVEKFYDENYLRAKHILFTFTDAEGNERSEEETLKLAQDVKKRLLNGESMDTLMAELSEDPGSQTNPDGYVFINTAGMDETMKMSLPSVMVDEFTAGTADTAVGKVSDPVKTSYGYHVIQRLDIRDEGIFEANKFNVINDMMVVYQEAFDAEYGKFITELEQKYPAEKK